jgi:type II secretion system protein N
MQLDLKQLWTKARERIDRRRLKRVAAYVLYALALTGVLLYYNFPTDKIKARVQAEFEAKLPARLVISKARVVFGPCLSLEGVAVQSSAGGAAAKTYLEIDRILLKPSWLTLLGGTPRIDYEITVNGGSAKGRLAGASEGKKTQLSAELKGIAIKRGVLFKEVSGLEMNGTLAGKLEMDLGASLAASTGKLDLDIAAGKLSGIDLEEIPVETVRFKNLKIGCELTPGKLTVRRADITPGDLSNKLSGTVDLTDDIRESKLALRGALGLSEQVIKQQEADTETDKGDMAYIISGTLSAPKFALEEAADQAKASGDAEKDDSGDEEVSTPAPSQARPSRGQMPGQTPGRTPGPMPYNPTPPQSRPPKGPAPFTPPARPGPQIRNAASPQVLPLGPGQTPGRLPPPTRRSLPRPAFPRVPGAEADRG